VILDVVYNHTAEAGELGPTLSLRGIDNAAYYRLNGDDLTRYVDDTGCGNSVNVRHPRALQLIMDSLRYWVDEMHVDGFRFDLAPALARERGEVDRCAAFLRMVQQDPVVSQVKLIAEPWDVGPGGYQLGNFPAPWAEWNGEYRGAIRDYWRGQPGALPAFVSRLAGSSQTFEASGRRPVASVNFVTCHDGFTLTDLVSYDTKHNEANGEDNRDGSDDNRSWNCGAEGPAGDPEIAALRARQRRNFLLSLLCSQGMPMLLAGDELGRTQQGNNNAYCQDNEISWLDWELSQDQRDLLEFTRAVIALRRAHQVFRRRTFLRGHPPGTGPGTPADVVWFAPGGEEMTEQEWTAPDREALAVFLDGADAPGPDGAPDTSFLLLFNPRAEPVTFALPDPAFGAGWQVVIDTMAATAGLGGPARSLPPGGKVEAPGRSALLLQAQR
jgi:glycogen operon protein